MVKLFNVKGAFKMKIFHNNNLNNLTEQQLKEIERLEEMK